MNLSGKIEWISAYFKVMPSSWYSSTRYGSILVDDTRKVIYCIFSGNAGNTSSGDLLIIEKRDYDFNLISTLPTTYYSSLGGFDYWAFSDIDKNQLVGSGRLVVGEYPQTRPMILNINHSDFSLSTIEYYDLFSAYSTSVGTGFSAAGRNGDLLYYVKEKSLVPNLGGALQYYTVNLSGTNINYNTGILAHLASNILFDHKNNIVTHFAYYYDDDYIELWRYNYDTGSFHRSSNKLPDMDVPNSQRRLNEQYFINLISDVDGVLTVAYSNLDSNLVRLYKYDYDLNLLGESIDEFSSTGYTRLVPINSGSELLSFKGTSFNRLLPQQSTSNKPLFSGDSNGTNQITKNKPLMDNRPHIVEIDTSLSGVTTNTQFQTTGMLGDYSVYYDNGSGVNGWFYNLTNEQTLTFPQADIYELHFYGKDNFQGFQFNNTGDKDKLLRITQWGKVDYSNRGHSFRGCSNLTEVVTKDSVHMAGYYSFRNCSSLEIFDVPEVIWYGVLRETFLGCNALDSVNFKGFKTHNITQMRDVFSSTALTKIDASYWDTRNLTMLAHGGIIRNSNTIQEIDVTGWNTTKLSHMSSAFININHLERIIGIEYWKTPNLTNMLQAFFQVGFSNPNFEGLDLSKWDMSKVVTQEQAFRGCKLIGDISKWDISSCENMDWNRSALSNYQSITPEIYTKCLIAWSQLNLQPNVLMQVGGTKYDASAQSAKDYIINTFGWTIIDGGQL